MSIGSTLLVTFDGLRRDRATADLMPNLDRFMREGSNFINSRSVFPSETRVAVTSTMTGCPPGSHGVVANQFIHPVRADGLFRTAEWDDLELAAQAGQLLDRPTMGQHMAKAGRTMAVVSTATKGASRMMNSSAHALSQPVFSMHGAPVSSQDLHQQVLTRFGEIPAAEAPNTARMTYATDVLIGLVYDTYDPDFCVYWMNDPDMSSHAYGVTAAQTAQAQKGCDDNFGRILDWWRAGNGPENIIVMSDHGQITGQRQLANLDIIPAEFGRASIGSFSGLYLHDTSDQNKQEVVDWLTRQDFCGLVFATAANGAPIAGALPWSAVRNNHARGADIGFTLRATDCSKNYGPDIDACIFAAWISPGGGMHGGLNKGELSTVLAAQGPAYRSGFTADAPCWLPDILPTVLTTMGLPLDGTEGRPLVEALAGADPRFGLVPLVETRLLHAECNGHEQYLRQWIVDGQTIVDCGWTAGTGAWSQ
ncbi:alkaline phosphatase family protein [Devosia sp. J2-20]|uniref:alkaline phosphatase family protein n=1 Tax=Devosia sp. J2-20 TaxID=3026161 RepID=UPI00249A70EC|nr:alkaline phosphatase family protein [Devosia sp. J2-20]WDQ98829.1 alkaline phosphatase family protein [Devosia sp. J2-20]